MRRSWGKLGPALSGGTLLGLAAVAGQGIAFLFLPVLARIYSPEDLGQFTLFLTIGSAIGALAALRYEMAIVLAPSPEESTAVHRLSYLVTSAVCTVVALVIMVGVLVPLGSGAERTGLPMYWLWLPLLVFGVSATSIETNRSLRVSDYRGLSINRIERPLLTNASQTVLPLVMTAGVGWLALSSAASYAVTAVSMRMRAGRMPLFRAERAGQVEAPSPDPADLTNRSLVRRYRNLPLLNGPNVFVDSLRSSGMLLIIGAAFQADALGQFSQAWRLLWIPVSLVSGVVSQVAFARMAAVSPLERLRIFRSTVLALSAGSVAIGAAVLLAGPWAFEVLMGSQWTQAGEVARALVPWLVMSIVASPASNLFIVLRRPGALLTLSVIYCAAVLASSLLGPALGLDVVSSSWLISAGGAMALLVILGSAGALASRAAKSPSVST